MTTGQPTLFEAAPRGRGALSAGIEATLIELDRAQRLRPEHAGLVQLARFTAERAEYSSGIAATNFAKQLQETLDRLLALEAPVEEDVEDDAGDRITKLSEYLRSKRSGPADVRDAEAS